MENYRQLFLHVVFKYFPFIAKLLKFLHQIAFFNSFSFIYSTTFSVEYFCSKLRKTN
jgi:hypothetical protein